MKTPFKLKRTNSAFPFKESPLKQGGPGGQLMSWPRGYHGDEKESTVTPIEVDPKIEEKKKKLEDAKEMKELYRKYEGLRRISLTNPLATPTSLIISTASYLWKKFWN